MIKDTGPDEAIGGGRRRSNEAISNREDIAMRRMSRIAAVVLTALSLAAAMPAAEIHEAVKSGSLAAVKAILDKDPAQLEAKDAAGRTPLHWAARGASGEILAYLAGRGAALDILDANGTAALHSLASRGNLEGIRILLDKGADIGVRNPENNTPLHFAAIGRQAGAIRLLAERKADLESLNGKKRSPLVLAAREMAGADVVRTLLELGADIDSADDSGDTALSLAAWRGSADVVSLLLERKAAVPVGTAKGRQILGYAVSKGLPDLFSLMVEKGADVAIQDARGRTLLHAAAEGGSVPILEILLGKGLGLDPKDINGWTPFHFAVDRGHNAACEWLLGKGVDAGARTSMGQSAYNLAEDNEDRDMMAFLAAKGFDRGPARFPELRGDFLGQKKPGRTSEVFAPGIVSGRYGLHSNIVFSPDGTEAYWSLMISPRQAGYSDGRTLVSRLVDGRWTYPRQAVFAGRELEDVVFFHPDGKHLFDMATRARPGGSAAGKENIWIWDKGGDGWANPRPLDASVNDLPQHWQFSVDREGGVYFSTSIPGGMGGGDIYVSRLADGRYQKPENLGARINTAGSEGFPFIAPDGRYLLFGRATGIFVSFRGSDGSWGEAKRLGREVNATGGEMMPMVTPDGKYLFYFGREGIRWIDAAVIEDVRPRDEGSAAPATLRQAVTAAS